MSDPKANVNYRPDGTMDIYNGTPNNHSHTVIGPDGRIIYDRGVGPDGKHTIFNDDQGRGPFTYQSPFAPNNPLIPPNPFQK